MRGIKLKSNGTYFDVLPKSALGPVPEKWRGFLSERGQAVKPRAIKIYYPQRRLTNTDAKINMG
ncbi:hypothetical protein SK128_012368 [Halocaridina rubra]|uniref:Uncharacterized protein n=1 Tax=Halocaridina rubra TaxID=373956 RepID=A0AAN8WKT4_HALRR